MADRIVVMNAGRIEQIGTPLELYDTPANLFVADFIGSPSMNVIRGTLSLADGGPVVETPCGTRLAVSNPGSGREGQAVAFGIRPEHMVLAPQGSGIPAVVGVVEPTGVNIQVDATMAGTPVCVMFTERHLLRPGTAIRLACMPDKIHLFDADSGLRL